MRVNCLAPWRRQMAAAIPLGRLGTAKLAVMALPPGSLPARPRSLGRSRHLGAALRSRGVLLHEEVDALRPWVSHFQEELHHDRVLPGPRA